MAGKTMRKGRVGRIRRRGGRVRPRFPVHNDALPVGRSRGSSVREGACDARDAHEGTRWSDRCALRKDGRPSEPRGVDQEERLSRSTWITRRAWGKHEKGLSRIGDVRRRKEDGASIAGDGTMTFSGSSSSVYKPPLESSGDPPRRTFGFEMDPR